MPNRKIQVYARYVYKNKIKIYIIIGRLQYWRLPAIYYRSLFNILLEINEGLNNSLIDKCI